MTSYSMPIEKRASSAILCSPEPVRDNQALTHPSGEKNAETQERNRSISLSRRLRTMILGGQTY